MNYSEDKLNLFVNFLIHQKNYFLTISDQLQREVNNLPQGVTKSHIILCGYSRHLSYFSYNKVKFKKLC